MAVREASVVYERLAFEYVEAPTGYIQTDFGMIPPDWACPSIGELAAKRPNAIVGGPFGSDLISKDYVAVGVPVVRGQNMSRHYVSGEFVFVSNSKAKSLQSNKARPDDIIFTQRGTLGQVSLVPSRPFVEYIVSQSQMKLTLNTNIASAEYVYQYFCSAEGQKQILESAIQTGVPHTNLSILRRYRVPVPPTRYEQQAIAEALSDADALIESLQQLITKKRQIKQGTMQTLLTGKQRLPGFEIKHGYKQTEVGVLPEEWEVECLGALARGIYRGASPRPIDAPVWFDETSAVGWVRISDVTQAGRDLTETTQRLSQQGVRHSRYLPRGALIMSICATVGRPIETQIDVCIHDGFVVFERPTVEQGFLYHVLKELEPRWSSKGQTGSQMNLNTALIKSTQVPLPPTEAEQTAIATVLSDMDSEIADLEARLAKTRDLKRGMMQALLTGRIRLPLDAVSETARDPSLAALARKV